jgi:hypothetical protein
MIKQVDKRLSQDSWSTAGSAGDTMAGEQHQDPSSLAAVSVEE